MDDSKSSMDAWVGCYVNRNIYNKLDVLLIPANTLLKQSHIVLLASQQVILDNSDLSSATNVRLLNEAVSETKRVFETVKLEKMIPLENIKDQIVPIITQFSLDPDLLHIISTMETKDEYTYKHSFAVAVISTMIGSWMELDEAQLNDLMIAAFLHDMGKLQIADEVLNKTSALTMDEFLEIKKHPEYGYNLISQTAGISQEQAFVALQHHERVDGSGYPAGLKGSEISLLSKIVAVADVFHAMISKRTYKDAIPLFKVLQVLYKGAFGLYDPQVIHCLISKVMSSLIGNHVILSNGEEAKVILVNLQDLLNPLVRTIKQEFIDLSAEKDLEIVKYL